MKRMMLLLVALLLAGAQTLSAQRTITGTIISADDNMTVPGASVSIRGTTIGTVADVNGRFSINVPADATHLVVSFMGMETQEIEIGGRTTVDVRLTSGALGLDEVVVTALGIQRSDRSLGFATSNVGGDDLVQRSEPDALRALEGRIPGVDIGSTGGAAGSSTRITIRGNTSFSSTGNNEPLIVVDGVPFSNSTLGSGTGQNNFGGGAFGNSFNTLDPNDIESVQVLRGAAAAALYGSRAANGVILITTRSGSRLHRPSRRGLEITVQSSWAWETISSLPDFQKTWGQGVNFRDELNSNQSSWGARFDRVDSIPAWTQFYAAFPHLFPNGMMAYEAHPNNVRDLFRTGFLQDYSFNVSSSNDRGVINMTASRMHQEGYVPHSHFTRTNFSVGGNTLLDNRIRVGGNIAFSNTDQLGSTQGAQGVTNPWTTSSMARVFFMARSWDISLPYQDLEGRPLNWTDSRTQFDNPLWEWQNNTHQTTMNRIVAQGNIGFDITDWLNATYQLGYNVNSTERRSIINIHSRAHGGRGSIQITNWQEAEMESNFMLTATRMLTPDISFQAVVGQNFNQRTVSTARTGGIEFLVPGVFTATNVAEPDHFSSTTIRRLSAVYADIALGFRNYLFLTLTGRNDWSSTLPRGNNNYFYPAVTTSFVVTDAFPDLQNNILSSLRLRAGWARVGNDAPVFLDFEGRNVTFGAPFRGETRMGLPTSAIDPNLTPEFTSEIELGGNLGLLDNRLNIDLTWYDRRTVDNIAPISVPQSTGFATLWTNFGEVKNTGIELAVEAFPVRNRHIEWSVGWNLTRNVNEVVSLTEGLERISWGLGVIGWPPQVLEPGMPYGFMQGTAFIRDTDGSLLLGLDGLPIRDSEERKIGDPNPNFTTSFLTTVRSHGFTLGVVFDWRQGGDIFSTFLSEMIGRGSTKFNEEREGGRVIPGYYANPNDPTQPLLDANGNRVRNTTMVTERALWFGGRSSFAVNADANEVSVFDATTFRLREVTLGYDIPREWLNRLPIGSAHVSFSARNLWFYSPNIPKHLNVDPIMSSIGAGSNLRGVQMNAVPSTRRFGINLRFTF